jgi:hypothetical protein
MELPQIDAVQLQVTEAHQHALAEILRSANWLPAIRPLAREAALRGNEHSAIRVERFSDERLAHERTV